MLNTNELNATFEQAEVKFLPIKHKPDGLIVQTIGEINTFNSSKFQAVVQKAIDSGYRYFIFNCANIHYLSSTGVGAFTFILKAVKAVSGQMVICEMRPKVYEVFCLLGFNKFFQIYDSLDKAIELISPPPIVEQKSQFPLIYSCPNCDKKFKIQKMGKYRCSSCSTIFAVDLEYI